ncbi:MAG: GNAT family N-acetyltransferase [Desulfobacteraceae bacterium]|nr:GNAT family N-acetyltransferase [Desulfobacteraceae bacterium]
MQTDRLILAPISANDHGFMAEFLSDSMLTRYLPKGGPYTGPEIEEYMAARFEHWETHGFGNFMLRKKSSGVTVGYAGLEHARGTAFVDIRYGIVQGHCGNGFALEAARAVAGYGFTVLGLTTLYGAAVPENEASLAVLRKIGMALDPAFDCYGDVVIPFSITLDRFRDKPLFHTKGA